jgi:aryl-alcohol dehydrogenase-like predicted oxidoreductase
MRKTTRDAPLGQKVSDPYSRTAVGNHRTHTVEAVEASLQQLNIDYIDVYVGTGRARGEGRGAAS